MGKSRVRSRGMPPSLRVLRSVAFWCAWISDLGTGRAGKDGVGSQGNWVILAEAALASPAGTPLGIAFVAAGLLSARSTIDLWTGGKML